MPDAADTVALGLVIISHGQLATELLNAAEMIAGPLPRYDTCVIFTPVRWVKSSPARCRMPPVPEET